MGQVSTLFVHKVVNVAAADEPASRTKRHSLFRSVGIDPEAPIDPKLMIEDSAYYSLCERVARETAFGPALSVHVGSSMRCDDYGAFGLAWKSALNLGRSYERAERFWRVLTSVSVYELRSEENRSFMLLHRQGDRRLGLRLSNEQTIVAIAQISREVSGQDFRPDAVYFKHKAPSDISAQERYFGCPVHFDTDRDALEISQGELSRPNRLGDATISQFFETHLEEELSQLENDGGLVQRVRIQISQTLSDGVPSVSDVAGRLGMSGRSLQRRLADQGYAYQELVDAARRELAEKLLRSTDYALAEIAFLTGFSEQSTFSRAFKRWRGQTPRSFRLETQSPLH